MGSQTEASERLKRSHWWAKYIYEPPQLSTHRGKPNMLPLNEM